MSKLISDFQPSRKSNEILPKTELKRKKIPEFWQATNLDVTTSFHDNRLRDGRKKKEERNKNDQTFGIRPSPSILPLASNFWSDADRLAFNAELVWLEEWLSDSHD